MSLGAWENESIEKEANLNKYRLDAGLTIQEVCDACNVPYHVFCNLNSGNLPPLYEINNRKNEIRESVKRLCAFFCVEFEDMFPRYSCKININNDLLSGQIKWICPDKGHGVELFNKAENKKDVKKALRTLTKKQNKVICYRIFQGFTLKETGEFLGLTQESVRRIEASALAKLRAFFGNSGNAYLGA